MANSSQSKKRARQQDARNKRNAPYRAMMRTYIKRVRKIIAEGGQGASEALSKAFEFVDKAQSKGLLHLNKAARIKSRLHMAVKKSQEGA